MKLFRKIVVFILILIILGSVLFYFSVQIAEPEVDLASVKGLTRTKTDSVSYSIGNNWITKNPQGLYEMYVEGPDFQRGYINGVLSQELVKKQEVIFVGKLEEMLPNKLYQNFLRAVVGWLNRNLDKHIDKEYLREIFGVSRSASPEFDFIAPAYQRILNYHAAHDIGHALQNMNLVACTSFGLWGKNTSDSSIIIGRNFDFYMGEDFAKEKIILFVKPDSGYKFMSVTWGGFIGIVSGMNEKGLTVTLNAAKSGVPGDAKTPVSIIGRKILQYSSTIEEAYRISKSYKSFVSESFMIGSKEDGKVAIIEKTPEKTTIYYPESEQITCSNHFQSTDWKSDSLNIQNIRESPTEFRRKRLKELLSEKPQPSVKDVAEILRNRFGPGNQDIGMGNEKALNQFVAHHSIIFNPTKGIVWVSATPYQLGAYVAYDLNKVFETHAPGTISTTNLNIEADTFLHSTDYQHLVEFKKIADKIRKIIRTNSGELSAGEITRFQSSNPKYFHTYMMLGDYYAQIKDLKNAETNYKTALTLDIPRKHDVEAIRERLTKVQEKR